MQKIHQGDILRIERIESPVVVLSKDFFNTSGEVIGCPIMEYSVEGPLHIYVTTEEVKGYVQCEKLALLDLNIRGYTKIAGLKMTDIINISDAVQGIFEYI